MVVQHNMQAANANRMLNDLLVPASDELISAVDTEHQTITMELPEGLLEL